MKGSFTRMDIVPQGSTQKQCTKCERYFPATAEFFNRRARVKSGLGPWCKECTHAASKSYQSRPEVKERMRTYHQTHREVYYSRPEIQEREKAYRKVYLPNYRSKNHERLSAQKKAAYQRPEVQEQYRIMRNVYYNRPETRVKLRERNNKRRAQQLAAPGIYTTQDMQEQYKRQKGKCYWCQQKVTWEAHHDDHIIPLSRGGTNWPDNMCVACPTCNLSRRHKLPHEWPEGGRLL